MKPEAFDNIYFIGIGGIGMSALARYFASKGKAIAGYDKTPSPITDALQEEGMAIHFEDDPENIPKPLLDNPDNSLVIYTPAIPETHEELNFLKQKRFPIYKRSAILGLLSQSKFTIAVGGTHGKTSTCAFIAHLLKIASIDFYGFLGGIATNYANNFISPEKQRDADIILAEADEYDRSFLHLTPDITILTSVDPDHLDIYGSNQSLLEAYKQFADQTKANGLLVHNTDIALNSFGEKQEKISFGLYQGDWHAEDIHIANNRYEFQLNYDHEKAQIQCGVPGEHNVLNVIAGFAAMKNLVKDHSTYQEAARTFRGVKRRFEYIIEDPQVVFVDDYAHHPKELDFTIKTLRKLYPEDSITGFFQPHLYTRTRDFAREFAERLSQLDRVVLLPIYPAREKPIKGISSKLILDYMKHPDKQLLEKSEVQEFVKEDDNRVITTLGAGDIDRLVKPIHKTLEKTRLS